MHKVLVAYLHDNEIPHSFHTSLQMLASTEDVRLEGPIQFRCGPVGLIEARNQVAAWMLDKSDADWLWCVDSDMGFAPDVVLRLVAAADPVERPIVGGLCFAMKEIAQDGMGGWVTMPLPTVYDWVTLEDQAGFTSRRNYPVNSLTRVAGTGAACVLIHRSVLQRMRDANGDTWFDRVVNPTNGQLIAEDLSFCAKAGALGIPVYVHTGVRTSHRKSVWLCEADYWQKYDPPPAAVETAVVVPVLNRPQNAEPFMRSLRASTGLASVYAVCDPDDHASQEAWKACGAQVLLHDGEHGTFSVKVNYGYRHTTEPWLFLVGDDVRFRPGWLDHAQHIAAAHGAQVVGTNDLGNPRVTAGAHATHMLIARSYVDELGASWDGPGVVAHEGYRHWFVDDEIVTCAKQRGVWGMAIASVVEHLHPAWGKAEVDETYRKGDRYAERDRRRFAERCTRQFGSS